MKYSQLKLNTAGLPFLEKKMLCQIEPKKKTLDDDIKYWLKTGKLLSIKSGNYLLVEEYNKIVNKSPLLEYIATQLIKPSYLSLEYILNRYGLLSEGVNAITLITPKSGREIISPIGSFRYYSINKSLFTGFDLKTAGNLVIAQATREKALFDYLYLRSIAGYVKSETDLDRLRINWNNLSRKDFRETRQFLKFTNNKTIDQLLNAIEKKYYA